jgi:hypothetical protein
MDGFLGMDGDLFNSGKIKSSHCKIFETLDCFFDSVILVELIAKQN